MYNGNGGNQYNGGRNYTSIGGFRIKPIYLYLGAAVMLLIAVYFLMQVLTTSLVIHFGLFAGVLLLLANVRELLGQAHVHHNSTALLNCLVGGALLFAWMSQVFSTLLWIPAILLLGVAVPLVLGRASVYTTYVQTARNAFNGVRRTVGR